MRCGCSEPPGRSRSRIELLIRKHGWAVQGVLADGPGYPGWTYTVGLADRGRPEMIMVGVPPASAHAIFHAVVAGAERDADKWPRPNTEIDGITCRCHPLRVISVPSDVIRAGDWFNVAKARRAGRFRADQLVWAGESGFPSESDSEQTLLGPVWW